MEPPSSEAAKTVSGYVNTLAEGTVVYLRLLIAYKSMAKRDREIYVKYPRDAILISTTVCRSEQNWAQEDSGATK